MASCLLAGIESGLAGDALRSGEKVAPQAKARNAFIARAVDPLIAIQWALYDRTGSGALKSGRRKKLGYCAEPSRFRAFMAKALFGSIVNAVL